MADNSLHPLFERCCMKSKCRYALLTPFETGGFYAATDGRVFVRMPKFEGGPSLVPKGPVPNMEELPWGEENFSGDWIRPTEIPEKEFAACVECEQTGTVMCEYGHTHECPRCRGHKRLKVRLPVNLGEVTIGDNYARMLEEYGATYRLPKQRNKPVYFVIPGTQIEGLLMPWMAMKENP